MSILVKTLGLSPLVTVVTAMLALLLGFASLFRMGYALMIEGRETKRFSPMNAQKQANMLSSSPQNALGPADMPISDYQRPGAGLWRDTNDLEPASVTERTTKLLEGEE
jgi:hypothetical protein